MRLLDEAELRRSGVRFLDDDDLTKMGIRPRSRAQRWRLIKDGKFPRPVKLGSRNAWPEDEILKWLADRVAERDRAA